MHVVHDNTAKAGQQPQKPAPIDKDQKQGTSGLFWLVIGVAGGAIAMHMIAKRMQEYAGGMYSKRAQLQARMQMMGMGNGPAPYSNPYTGGGGGGETVVDLDDDDGGGGGWFG